MSDKINDFLKECNSMGLIPSLEGGPADGRSKIVWGIRVEVDSYRSPFKFETVTPTFDTIDGAIDEVNKRIAPFSHALTEAAKGNASPKSGAPIVVSELDWSSCVLSELYETGAIVVSKDSAYPVAKYRDGRRQEYIVVERHRARSH